jgi:V/A-type H+-transporting ATPase subunit A
VGPDALAEAQREVLAIARLLREDFLQQMAYDEVDRYCPLEKTAWMLQTILEFHRRAVVAVQKGLALENILALPALDEIARMKALSPGQAVEQLKTLIDRLDADFASLPAVG